MTRPRLGLRRRWLLWLAVPPVLWLLIVVLVPTGWARDRLVARLSEATGEPVQLDALRIGLAGGVRLVNLRIGQPGTHAEPWLRVDSLRVNLNLVHLLFGQCEPTKIKADGVSLRVHRQRNGTFEFGDLLRTNRADSRAAAQDVASSASASGSGTQAEPCLLEIRLGSGQVSLIDEPSETRLEFSEVEGRGTWDRNRAAIQDLHGLLNGGRFQLVAQLDRSTTPPQFEGQVRAEDVALHEGMGALGYLLPVLAGAPASAYGKLDLNLYVRGQGTSRGDVLRSLVGRGAVALDPLELEGSRLVADLVTLIDLPPKTRIGSVQSQFAIGHGRVASDRLTLNLAQVPIVLSGWTDFDGRIDYRVKQEGLTSRLSKQARDLLADLPIDLDDLMALRVQGTLSSLEVTVDGKALYGNARGEPSRHEDERLRLREVGRRLRDRFLH